MDHERRAQASPATRSGSSGYHDRMTLDAHQAGGPRPRVRIGVAGVWDSFDPADTFFTRLLARRYDVEVCADPDFLIHSCIGRGKHDHQRHDGVRIFYSGENVAPDWHSTDWAFTFGHSAHPRHFRLPLWALYLDPATLVKPATTAADTATAAAAFAARPRFCGFVVSNPLCRVRNEFFQRLSRYRPVDSGGRVFNTLGYRVPDKPAFLAECRFTIAFENESSPGYTTEKIVEPMGVGSIPIYWGDPLVGRDFDTRSFLSAHDSPALADLVDRVVAVDRDPALQAALLAHPWYRGNRVPACADPDAILDRFTTIFETPIAPVARRRSLARSLRLHRLPAAAASLRRRIVRRCRKAAWRVADGGTSLPPQDAALVAPGKPRLSPRSNE
ncbi:MAG: glycosyltransferase family 10 domain-containing protein [Planctomycetia bacterium]